jgi:hypothetical protein
VARSGTWQSLRRPPRRTEGQEPAMDSVDIIFVIAIIMIVAIAWRARS